MHDKKYFQYYLKRWIAKYNLSQKKKFLEAKKQSFLVDKRNKLFTNWMR